MAEELGRITKPEAEQFKKGRRLFLVPLIFSHPSPPPELESILQRYWGEARHQIAGLERRIGNINRVYHEMVADGGDKGLKTLESLNPASHYLVKRSVEQGAGFTPVEDSEILTEFMDWSRCLSVGLFSHKVLNTVLNAYQESQQQRNQAMATRIDESLGSDEIGLLIVSENHRIQFAPDIEVFYVAPPALDEFKRWLRQQEFAGQKQEEAREEAGPGKPPETKTSGKKAPSGGRPAKKKTASSRKPGKKGPKE